MPIKQLQSVEPRDQNEELWRRVRELIDTTNDIETYLNALAASYGAFAVDFLDTVTTSPSVWEALDVTMDPNFTAVGFTIENSTQITATKDIGRGIFGISFLATGIQNNRTYSVGLQANGTGPIYSESFDSGTLGLIRFAAQLPTNIILAGGYLEILVSSDISDT